MAEAWVNRPVGLEARYPYAAVRCRTDENDAAVRREGDVGKARIPRIPVVRTDDRVAVRAKAWVGMAVGKQPGDHLAQVRRPTRGNDLAVRLNGEILHLAVPPAKGREWKEDHPRREAQVDGVRRGLGGRTTSH